MNKIDANQMNLTEEARENEAEEWIDKVMRRKGLSRERAEAAFIECYLTR